MGQTAEAKKVTTIQRKTGFDWSALKKKVEAEHWKKLKVTIRLRHQMHGGVPMQLDAAKAMLKARGLEEVVEAREAEVSPEERAETVVDEGLCQFHRREGKPGLWWPTNHFKACLKENWSVLGYNKDATPRSQRGGEDVDTTVSVAAEEAGLKGEKKKAPRKALQGSRAMLAEGLFVKSTDPEDPEFVYLGEEPAGIRQGVSHTTGPKGPQSSIKRNEFIVGQTLEFEVWIARAGENKVPDESFADTLLHAQEHGIGANRSQGFGTFNIVSVEEFE